MIGQKERVTGQRKERVIGEKKVCNRKEERTIGERGMCVI